MKDETHAGLLRVRGESDTRVTSVELFFDLVYVLAVTQLTDHLLHHLTLRGAGETAVLLLAVCTAWAYTAWTTNWFDPDTLPVRLMLVGVMLGSLLMSAWLPHAFGDRGLQFACAFAAIQIGRNLFVVIAIGPNHELSANFRRILVWVWATSAMWIAGGFAHGGARPAIWAAAWVLDAYGVWRGFPVPGMGHSHTSDWTIAGEHLAERSQLFVMIALGESILVIGAKFGELGVSAATVTAFVVAFIQSVALWWIYFSRAAEAGRQMIVASEDPGRLGRSAYTYFQVPMIAGVIVAAAADELTIAHPTAEATATTTALILGGPALYLLGNTLFKWAIWQVLSRPRLLALAALAALVPVAQVASALVLLLLTTLVVVTLAAWDVRSYRTWEEPGLAP